MGGRKEENGRIKDERGWGGVMKEVNGRSEEVRKRTVGVRKEENGGSKKVRKR